MFESIFGRKKEKSPQKEPNLRESFAEAGEHGRKAWEHLGNLGQKLKDNPEEAERLLDAGAQLWSLFAKRGEIDGVIKKGWERVKKDPAGYRYHGAELLLKVGGIVEEIELDRAREKIETQSRTLKSIMELGGSMEEEARLKELSEANESSIKGELDDLLCSLMGDSSEEETIQKMARVGELKRRIAEISKNKKAKGREAGDAFIESKLEELRR